MVRHHVAQRAGGIVEAAAVADAELLVDGDLDMVDMVAIPDRLEHAVGKSQHQDVLHRLLAEIMIDPVDLVLVHQLQELGVEVLGRFEVGAERLFDHQPTPRAVFLQHAGAAELHSRSAGKRPAASPDRTAGCRRSCARLRFCRAVSRMASNEAGSFGSASMQVTQDNSFFARSSSILRVAYWRKPFIRLSDSCAVVMPLRAMPTMQKLSGNRLPAARL